MSKSSIIINNEQRAKGPDEVTPLMHLDSLVNALKMVLVRVQRLRERSIDPRVIGIKEPEIRESLDACTRAANYVRANGGEL